MLFYRRLLIFPYRLSNIVNYFTSKRSKFVISNQLLKSGTSIGANVREAQNSESKNDFIHKFKIAAKEIEETNYWLLLCKHSENYPDSDCLLLDLKEIENIINKIIITSKMR